VGLSRAQIALPLAATTALFIATPAHAAGLKLVRSKRLGPRLTELTFTTPALNGTTGVRVLTPKGYKPHGKKRYPVLYRSGRLHLTVPLGPANQFQEYTTAADLAGLKLFSTTVRIGPA
jgi:hypothetical protein